MRCYYFYILGNESGPVYSLLLSGNMIGEIVLCILSHTKVKKATYTRVLDAVLSFYLNPSRADLAGKNF